MEPLSIDRDVWCGVQNLDPDLLSKEPMRPGAPTANGLARALLIVISCCRVLLQDLKRGDNECNKRDDQRSDGDWIWHIEGLPRRRRNLRAIA